MKHGRKKAHYAKSSYTDYDDFARNIDEAFAKDPGRVYKDRFYELSDKEIFHEATEILNRIGIVGDGKEQPGVILRYDGFPDLYNDLKKYGPAQGPVAVFLRKNGTRYQRIISCAKTICAMVQETDKKAMFRVSADKPVGCDLRLEITAKAIHFDDVQAFITLAKNADGGMNLNAGMGGVILELWFLNAYKVVGIIGNNPDNN